MLLYKDKINLDTQVENILSYLTNNIELQNLRKTNLLKLLEEVCSNVEELSNFNNSSEVISILDNLKSSLNKVRYNIDKLNELCNLLNDFKSLSSEDFDIEQINNYNELSCNYEKEIFENDIYIENFLNKYISFSANFYSQVEDVNDSTVTEESTDTSESEQKEEETSNSEIVDSQTENDEQLSKDETEEVEDEELSDNDTLLISEIQGKVFLPYKIDDLKDILANSVEYDSLEDIIDDNYILPISRFKNPIFSRFKEAFYLMKNKEKAPLFDCLNLALELSTNTYLNPAIITACENLDELDIYLDYLADDETEKFDIFNIEYEILPTKKRKIK